MCNSNFNQSDAMQKCNAPQPLPITEANIHKLPEGILPYTFPVTFQYDCPGIIPTPLDADYAEGITNITIIEEPDGDQIQFTIPDSKTYWKLIQMLYADLHDTLACCNADPDDELIDSLPVQHGLIALLLDWMP